MGGDRGRSSIVRGLNKGDVRAGRPPEPFREMFVGGDGLIGRAEAAHRDRWTELDADAAATAFGDQRFEDLDHDSGAVFRATSVRVRSDVQPAVEELGKTIR